MKQDDYIITDDIDMSDVRVNPEYYIHTGILRAQIALGMSDDYKEGVKKFVAFVEHIESIAKGFMDLKDSEYADKIKEEKEKDVDSNQDIYLRLMRIANKKIELLMRNIKGTKTITSIAKI